MQNAIASANSTSGGHVQASDQLPLFRSSHVENRYSPLPNGPARAPMTIIIRKTWTNTQADRIWELYVVMVHSGNRPGKRVDSSKRARPKEEWPGPDPGFSILQAFDPDAPVAIGCSDEWASWVASNGRLTVAEKKSCGWTSWEDFVDRITEDGKVGRGKLTLVKSASAARSGQS